MGKIYTEPVLHSAYNLFQFLFYFFTLDLMESIIHVLYRLAQTQKPRVHPLTQRLNTWQVCWIVIYFFHSKIQTRFWEYQNDVLYFKQDRRDHIQQCQCSVLSCFQAHLEPGKFSPLVWLV